MQQPIEGIMTDNGKIRGCKRRIRPGDGVSARIACRRIRRVRLDHVSTGMYRRPGCLLSGIPQQALIGGFPRESGEDYNVAG